MNLATSTVVWPLALAACAPSATRVQPPPTQSPKPVAPRPSPRQLAWQELGFTGFVHFNMNTFTGREWGDGNESPDLFAPSALDCAQWVEVARAAGMRGIVLTAKHHDGFCLWPSAQTRHSVASSTWRVGKGDVVRELSDACRAAGIGFGVYLSPWDRNAASYGDSHAYNDFYAAQLEELLGNYGEVFEVWWDGACGEGPDGKKQVYDFERFTRIVRRLQPDAVIFSDIGPDVRWVGNEAGFAGETCWSMLNTAGFSRGIGAPPTRSLTEGDVDGANWIPAECDVSIRPGWYYHAEQDGQVKTPEQLFDLYERSLGHNGQLLLNLPVDKRGRVHENDAAALAGLAARVARTYGVDLARAASARADSSFGDGTRHAADRVLDGDASSYWAPAAEARDFELILEFDQPQTFDRVALREPIAMGQRVSAFRLEVRDDDRWREVFRGTTIGNRRIARIEPCRASALRVRIDGARALPLIASVELYLDAKQPDPQAPSIETDDMDTDLWPALQFFRAPDAGARVLCAAPNADGWASDASGASGEIAARIDVERCASGSIAIYEGCFQAPVDGFMEFSAPAAHARLSIDDREIFDTRRSRARGRAPLQQGWHRFRLELAGGPSLDASPGWTSKGVTKAWSDLAVHH